MSSNQLQDIKQTITIQAPIQKVWSYISTSEGIAAWLMPNDFEAKVGNEFHIQSPFGPSPCKVLEIDEPNVISFSWDTDGWVVTVLLKEIGDQTELTIIHGGWKGAEDIIPKANQKSSMIHAMMTQGWIQIVSKIKSVIDG